jgi:urease accessory protein
MKPVISRIVPRALPLGCQVCSNSGQKENVPEPAINLSTHIDLRAARPAQPRAIGTGVLSVRSDGLGKTRLADLRMSGATKLVFPNIFRPEIEAILVNTAGGITGGDDYRLAMTVQENAALTLTTQAAERAYRAQPGEIGQVTTTLSVENGARLNWLPQELILFERCGLHRRLSINLDPGAQLLMVEPVVFGRALMNEDLRDVHFHDRISINRDARPLYVDGMRLDGDAARHLGHRAIADGAGAMASVVLVRADAEAPLAHIRAALPDTAGASLIAHDTLVIRLLAADSFELRRTLIPILNHLSDNTLPTSWRL